VGKEVIKLNRKYTRITPAIVAKTKRYLADDRGFSKAEVARLMGIGINSVNRIVQGHYDQPVEEVEETQAVDSEPRGSTVTEIPYEKVEYLMKCEMFVDELFSIAILSDKGEDELYFPRHRVSNMCERYFPDKTRQALNTISL